MPHVRRQPYEFRLQIDSSWSTGFQFTIVLRNLTTEDFGDVSFLLVYGGELSWVQDLREEKIGRLQGLQLSRMRPESYLPAVPALKEVRFSGGVVGPLEHLYLGELRYTPRAVQRPLAVGHLVLEGEATVQDVMNHENNAPQLVATTARGTELRVQLLPDRWAAAGNLLVNGGTLGLFAPPAPRRRPFVGTLADDTPNSLAFWRQEGHVADSRYLYLNGGPKWGGWRYNYATEEKYLAPGQIGRRAVNFLENSKGLGMAPCFVYYNINNGSDSFSEIMRNIQDERFMGWYREDILALCEIVNGHWNGPLAAVCRVRIILEPDFIGYICQNAGKHPLEIPAVPVIDDYPRNLRGLVTSVVDLFRNSCPALEIGWQFNVWSTYTAGKAYPGGRGLIPARDSLAADAWRNLMQREAMELAVFATDAGCGHGVDFICFDKYGLDAGFEKKLPQQSNWFWNYELWRCYIDFVQQVSIYMKDLPVVLWQIPVGHISDGAAHTVLNNTNNRFEDSAAAFFFGQEFATPGAGGTPQEDPKLTYLAQYAPRDLADRQRLLVFANGATTVWRPYYPHLLAQNVIGVYFGAGVGISTSHAAHTFLEAPTDGGFMIRRMAEYIRNPVVLALQ